MQRETEYERFSLPFLNPVIYVVETYTLQFPLISKQTSQLDSRLRRMGTWNVNVNMTLKILYEFIHIRNLYVDFRFEMILFFPILFCRYEELIELEKRYAPYAQVLDHGRITAATWVFDSATS